MTNFQLTSLLSDYKRYHYVIYQVLCSQVCQIVAKVKKTPWTHWSSNPTLIEPLLSPGQKRRLGLMGAKRTTITVHRSEEVLPSEVGRHLVRQSSSMSSEGDAGGGGVSPSAAGNPDDPLEGVETERWGRFRELFDYMEYFGTGREHLYSGGKSIVPRAVVNQLQQKSMFCYTGEYFYISQKSVLQLVDNYTRGTIPFPCISPCI